MSPNPDELSDFQRLYKEHFQEKLCLRKHVRALEFEKVTNMRSMLQKESVFKTKYQKFIPPNRRQTLTPRGCRRLQRPDVESMSPRNVSAVGKHCPYSYSTWESITDLDSRGLVERYRSDVINSEPSENTPNLETGADGQRHPGSANLSVAQTSREGLVASAPTALRRKLAQHPNSPNQSEVAESPVSGAVFYSDKQTYMRTDTKRIVHNKQSVSEIKKVRIQINGEEVKDEGNSSACPRLPNIPGIATRPRARSFTIDNAQRPVLTRSKTFCGSLSSRRSASVGALQAFSATPGRINMKHLDQLLSASLERMGFTDGQQADERDIFENVRNCRYLRIPNDNSESCDDDDVAV